MTDIWNESAAYEALADDPVIAVMARIIREQYSSLTIGVGVLAKDVNVVVVFNDCYAQLPDIRAVIEKTIAEGL